MLYERVKTICSSVKPLEPQGSRWHICALTASKSENNAYYPAEVLENDFQGMEGVNSYLYRLDNSSSMVFDHLPEEYLTSFDAPLMGHLIGWCEKPQIEKLDGITAITADLYLHRSAQPVRNFFLDCWEHGKEIGFSITALTAYSERVVEGEPVHWIEKLWFISCDPVSYPAVKGARVLKLLESVKKEARKEMDSKVLERLLETGKKIAPELETKGNTRDAGIAYCSQLVETLSTDCFPDSSIRERLVSLRQAIETDNDAVAEALLTKITTDFETARTLASVVEKLRASIQANQFEEAQAAYKLCLEEADKIDYKAFREKLVSLQTLLNGKEWEAAAEYLTGLIEMISKEMYPETYPTPAEIYPTPEEVYPLPPEETPAKEETKAPIPIFPPAGELEASVEEIPPKVAETTTRPLPDKGAETGRSVEVREGSEAKIMSTPTTEAPGIRITRIELESILKSSGLPSSAQEKIKKSILNSEVSRESIQQAVVNERAYLTSVGLSLDNQETEIQKAVREATAEARAALEKEAQLFKTEIAAFRESAVQAQAQFKTELNLVQESSLKAQTQEKVKRLLKESFLPAVCARRIEAMFADRAATEEEIKTAITAEASLTSEVIASIASTVTGFGETEPVTDEATAESYVKKFFDARLSADNNQ